MNGTPQYFQHLSKTDVNAAKHDLLQNGGCFNQLSRADNNWLSHWLIKHAVGDWRRHEERVAVKGPNTNSMQRTQDLLNNTGIPLSSQMQSGNYNHITRVHHNGESLTFAPIGQHQVADWEYDNDKEDAEAMTDEDYEYQYQKDLHTNNVGLHTNSCGNEVDYANHQFRINTHLLLFHLPLA